MIATLHDEFPAVSVRRLCAVFGVSRSWFYAARQRGPATDDRTVVTQIEAILAIHPGYGYRRVTAALRRQGVVINRKRVLRLMGETSLLCQVRRYVRHTPRSLADRRYPNLIADLPLLGPDQVWVADLTYLHFPRATGYLACVLDAWSRRVIGWALGDALTTDLTEAALAMALATRQPGPGLIHHSDQGVQYANHRYLGTLRAGGIRISMAAVGRPTENAKIEAFFSTLKREEVYLHDYQTLAEARVRLTQFLDDVYNTKRLHSSLGYRPPAEFEQVAA